MRKAVQGLLVTATALVAAAAGVGGTLLYQRITAPDTSAVDAQAAALAQDLRQDLTAGFYSAGGGTYGGQFTEGTLVAQTEEHGGALLSVRSAGLSHTAEVMLGLVPPTGTTVDADAYPVRCYRLTFARGAHSVRRTTFTCPVTQADGRPGSLAAQLGGLLARQPATASAYRKMSAAGYDHTADGATRFLTDKGLVAAKDTVTDLSGRRPAPASTRWPCASTASATSCAWTPGPPPPGWSPCGPPRPTSSAPAGPHRRSRPPRCTGATRRRRAERSPRR